MKCPKLDLVITAGGGKDHVLATDLTTDSTELTGDASFNNIEIGNDASTLTKAGVKGKPGVFSQQADHVHIEGRWPGRPADPFRGVDHHDVAATTHSGWLFT